MFRGQVAVKARSIKVVQRVYVNIIYSDKGSENAKQQCNFNETKAIQNQESKDS